MGITRLSNRRRQDQSFKWARVSIAILSTIGVIDTGSITMHKWGWIGTLACPGGNDGCTQVLDSHWGTIFSGNSFSLPLSFLGLLGYMSILSMAIAPLLPGISENKNDLSRRTWWGLFYLSTGMTIFSLLLLSIMIFKIEAFCFFCVLSAVISILILLLTIIGGRFEEIEKLIFRGTIISIVVILCGLIWSNSVDPSKNNMQRMTQGVPPEVITNSTQEQIQLAEYLTSKDIKMYSAYWCPHCHDQKEMFGKEASSKLIIIECAIDGVNNQKELCKSKGVTGFPSWEINGSIESGVKSLQEIAEITNFPKK